MKKTIISGLVILGTVIPMAAFAVSTAGVGPTDIAAQIDSINVQIRDYQAKIQVLQDQIGQLKQQLPGYTVTAPILPKSGIIPGNPGVPTDRPTSPRQPMYGDQTCYIINRSLDLGAQGDDVKSVQQFLNDEGYMVNVTGKYDDPTAKAVGKFQIDNNIQPVKIVGPLTRAKINFHLKCGGLTPPTTPVSGYPTPVKVPANPDIPVSTNNR